MTIEEPWKMPETEWRPMIDRVRAGRALKPATWPAKSRCALALSFDCDHECFELGGGGNAIGRLAWGEFGRRVGVPRILSVLARHSVPASFFVPAVCALIDPSEVPRIHDAGHEVGMHGWIHENNARLDAGTERDLMLRARDLLHGQLGTAPLGFRSANWDLSSKTIEIVRELGLEYDSSLMADESCYELLLDGNPTGVVEVPVEWLRDDAVYLMFNRIPATRPWTAPEDVFNIFRREFDAAYEERGLFQLVLHPFVIGYRSRIWILEQLIEHAKSKHDVWFGTHAQVARWVRNECRL
ncbi:MAG: polysaccharide deacetylase [Gammaproteobacteria bacterium]|nr:polysaccharide deacetylase [Gammaproteobacteria bacterium]MDH4315644.1 polysaccharide deacetylase [Gammaproteobacteria bacterium]MDH5214457.1 polysaccharide deacetylase [Gammaproteobacteria bacterium]